MDVQSVAIIGAGLMGTAIAAAHLKRGIPVLLYDAFPKALAQAPGRIEEELAAQRVPFDSASLQMTDRLGDVVECPILIESIPEKIRLKHKLYKQLKDGTGLDSPASFLLFSNTSTISIGELAVAAPDPARFCGFHFFHPVRERSLLEIIPGKQTDPSTVDLAREHALKMGKQPVIVGDGPGFLVNRLLHPYLNESLALLAEGVSMERIERVATDYGMALGPFRIMDEIGLDVVLHGGWVLTKAFPEQSAASPLLVEMVARGLLGRKTGAGFFLHHAPGPCDSPGDGNGDGIVNNALITSYVLKNRAIQDGEILDRLFLGMFLEALRCIEDSVIRRVEEAGFAAIHGLGFPASRGGLEHRVNELGFVVARNRLKELESKYGPRFRTNALFLSLYQDGVLV
ncbi:MAG TPA: hypothetical protein DEB39_11390 [Planctomycetaceae bacterium]|nr:hypothetical protein [Planctomycetaceae bacterium]